MARILVIDDEEHVRTALAEVLKQEGHEVSVAENSEQGLAVYGSQEIDLAVVDIMMPGESGLATMRHIRQGKPDFPIIAITGASEPGLEELYGLAHVAGATQVLPKPFRMEELVEAVGKLLA